MQPTSPPSSRRPALEGVSVFRHRAQWLIPAVLAGVIGGCDAGTEPATPDEVPTATKVPSTVPTSTRSDATSPVMPESIPPTQAGGTSAPAVQASNAFAFDLHRQLATKPGNLAYSPASISIALAMTFGGARGETAAEMTKVMHFPAADALHGGWATAVKHWQTANEDYALATANRLFGEKTYTFEKAFLDATKASYGAPLDPRDFRNDSSGQRSFINGWVEKQTRKRIVDLLPPPAIDAETRLVLVNALYLEAEWQTQFAETATRADGFFVGASKSVKTPMMNKTSAYRYAATDGVQLLEMPYEGGDLSMVVLLPDARDGLAAVEKKLDATTLAGWMGKMKHERVWLTLPKFEIDPPEAIDLADTLKGMGMPLAFDPDRADFTGIANPPNPADRLYIGHVFHKAFVAVDEAGTEAAAATAVVMPRAGSAAPADPTRFQADHPFLFFIRDVKNDAILFVGRVSDPTAKG